eukprot:scaffold248621_cov41-Prasinocladus_malaysianus.AAC.2
MGALSDQVEHQMQNPLTPGHGIFPQVHVLESVIVTWARQIKNVIKSDSEAPLKISGNHPGPLVELDFWTARAANLNSIFDQLSGEKVQKVVAVLEVAQSSYYPAFQRMFKDVVQARRQANDNVKFLRPLRNYFDRLNLSDEFAELVQLFKPIMHTLLLIWKHSKYYKTAGSFVVLIREICNDLIMQACKYVPGDEIMGMEAQEAVDKLRMTLKVLGTFKSYFFDYKVWLNIALLKTASSDVGRQQYGELMLAVSYVGDRDVPPKTALATPGASRTVLCLPAWTPFWSGATMCWT